MIWFNRFLLNFCEISESGISDPETLIQLKDGRVLMGFLIRGNLWNRRPEQPLTTLSKEIKRLDC